MGVGPGLYGVVVASNPENPIFPTREEGESFPASTVMEISNVESGNQV